MMEMFCYIRSEFYKQRHSLFFIVHILIPICGVIVILLISNFAAVSSINKLITFIQIAAMAYPIIISIVCEVVVEQEMMAGACQNILSLPSRYKVVISKLFLLIVMGLFAILLSTIFFTVFLSVFDKTFEIAISKVIFPSVVMWLSNIPLYIIHLILAFKFGKNVCVSVGAIGSLISALMQTGLGTGIWYVCPYGLGIRLSELALTYSLHLETGVTTEIGFGIQNSIVMTGILFVVLIAWFSHYGGKRAVD